MAGHLAAWPYHWLDTGDTKCIGPHLILTLFEDTVTQPADVEYEHETSTTKD